MKINNLAKFTLLIIIISVLSCQKSEYEVPLLPLEDFFKDPQNTNFALSQNGKFIASLRPWKNRLNIFVQKIGSDSLTQVTQSDKRDIEKFYWASDEKILYLQDYHVNDNYSLFCSNLKNGKTREITKSLNYTTRFVDDLPDYENEIIIETNERNPQLFDVYRLNLENGKKKVIGQNPGNVTHWLTDFDGKLRVAMTTDGVNHDLLYRKRESDKFKVVKKISYQDEFYPILFTPDNRNVYVISNEKGDRTALIKYDIENNYEMELIYEHPEVDIEYVRYSRKLQDVVGVSVITDKREFYFWNNERQQIQSKVERKLPNMEINVVSMDKEESKIVIKVSSDKSYGAFYLYEVAEDKLIKISEISPWLDTSQMSSMNPIRYISRDGFTIHGYLTLPRMSVSKNLPTVVFPHGGPWYRDKWGFNRAVQFYANRGYAVLQVNFRGSKGYGKKFSNAGYKEWGGKIQDDITDGVNWLVDQGIADQNRIGIIGYSFGGYSALQNIVKNPDLYACGVSLAGMTDLTAFLESIPPTWIPFKKMLYEIVGDPAKDRDMLIATSPYYNTENIKIPLLIAQGANDTKVKKSQTDNFIKKLRKNGVKTEYIVKENEGHGFKNVENRIDFYRASEKFLAKHLSGRIEKK